MTPLRLIGAASNVAFMSYALLGLQYGVFGQLYPILVLHAVLLPLNVIRLRQVRRVVDAVGAASDDEAIRALVPYTKSEERPAGFDHASTKPKPQPRPAPVRFARRAGERRSSEFAVALAVSRAQPAGGAKLVSR